jgi:hypothetical protein
MLNSMMLIAIKFFRCNLNVKAKLKETQSSIFFMEPKKNLEIIEFTLPIIKTKAISSCICTMLQKMKVQYQK